MCYWLLVSITYELNVVVLTTVSCDQEPVSRKSRELFGPEKPVVKRQSSCFGEKLILKDVFNVRKTKRIAKFDGLEPRRC